jgi:hypothetical protein
MLYPAFEVSSDVTSDIPLFEVSSLIMKFFSFAQTYIQLDMATLSIYG